MAFIDYGALLMVDGKFVNKNSELFMKSSDCGYICEYAKQKNGSRLRISGNYFVYAGDKEFMVAVYKRCFVIVSNGMVLKEQWGTRFNSETLIFDGLPNVQVKRLSKEWKYEKVSIGTWKDYVKENWINATGNEKLSELQDGYNEYKRFVKRLKRASRYKGVKSRPDRFLIKWEYRGKEYQVIFGHGIDPNEKVWNRIKNESYDFRKDEIELIDKWFMKH